MINSWQTAALGHDDRTRAALRTIHALHELRERLFLDTGGLGDRTDRKLYDDAVASTLVTEPELFRLSTVLEKMPEPPPELQKARVWLKQIVKPQSAPLPPLEEATKNEPADPLPPQEVDKLLCEIQGNILNSNVLDHGAPPESAKLVLVRCRDSDAMRALLRWAHQNVTSEKAIRTREANVPINFGLTYYGIKLLGLPKHVLELFPREFQEGMEERAGLLGDVAHNHPHNWKLPVLPNGQERAHLSTVHAAFVLQGATAEVAIKCKELQDAGQNTWELVHTLDLKHSGQPELSQPIPPRALRPPIHQDQAYSPLDVRTLSQFLLGYDNPKNPSTVDDEITAAGFFKNGCFMAMRKMAIHKTSAGQPAVQAYVDKLADQIAGQEVLSPADRQQLVEELAALVVGRKPNGQMLGPLQPSKSVAANAFDFSKDPEGRFCPLGSHVRRSNPRLADTPRIARRGIPYKQAAAEIEPEEEGLLFMACCASLSAQYEVVQRWVNGGNATGIPSNQNDPLCGAPVEHRVPRVVSLEGTIAAKFPGAPKVFTLQLPVDPFITLRWGMYLFMPSLPALELLQDKDRLPGKQEELSRLSVARGRARLAELDALPAARRMHELRRLLEEVPEGDSPQALHARDVTAAITADGGARRFAAESGDVIVVTTAARAQEVLSGDGKYSVSEYRNRMKQALMDHYLGYDRDSHDRLTGLSYAQLSEEANRVIAGLAYKAEREKQAYEIAKKLLAKPGPLQLDPDGTGPDRKPRSTISVKDLAEAVIGELCHEWLDMPGEGRATAANPADVENTLGWMGSVQRLLIASRYCFQAYPVAYLKVQAANNQSGIEADYRAVHPVSDLAKVIAHQYEGKLSNEEIKRLTTTTLLGAVGFAPPAVGAITRIFDYWIENEELWQIQRNLESNEYDLRKPILAALSKVPAPPTLYRTATAQTQLGSVSVSQGALVIVNLAAAYEDAKPRDPEPEAWFFGGKHNPELPDSTQHGCPGRAAGMVAIEQIVRAVLERKNLRREGRLLLSYDC